VVFGHEKKEMLLQATLSWYREQPEQFWSTAWKGEFPDATAFSEYFQKAVRDKWSKASHFVAICLSRQREEPGKKVIPEWEEQAAVACAVHNMHLMATSMHIAAYWSSWFQHYCVSTDIAHFLGLESDKGDRCMGIFVIGRSNKMDKYRATRKDVAKAVTWR